MKVIPSEGGGIIAKQAVYLGGFVGWFGTHAQRDVFSQCVGTFGCNGFLSGKNTLEFRPVMSDALQFKFLTDSVDYPICQQPEEKVSIGTFVFLMVDGTQVQVGFELTVRGLNFANLVVILPC